jgi:hypothetical protein
MFLREEIMSEDFSELTQAERDALTERKLREARELMGVKDVLVTGRNGAINLSERARLLGSQSSVDEYVAKVLKQTEGKQ